MHNPNPLGDGVEELAIAQSVARQWASRFGLDVDEATGLCAAGIVAARPSWDPARGPWGPFAAVRARGALVSDYRRRTARKRAKFPIPLDDHGRESDRGPMLARDELRALVVARGATPRQADIFVSWLGGETIRSIAVRLGVRPQPIQVATRRVRDRLGLSPDQARALRGVARGESPEALRWAIPSSKVARAGKIPSNGYDREKDRERVRERRSSRPVSLATVFYRQRVALERLGAQAVAP